MHLTRSVLDETKKRTSRDMARQPKGDIMGMINFTRRGKLHHRADFNCGYSEDSKYSVGEIVAVAQCYEDVASASSTTDYYSLMGSLHDNYAGIAIESIPAWNNKMFIKASLMPHQIKITNVRVERLQDISDEDCIKEGVIKMIFKGGLSQNFEDMERFGFKGFPGMHYTPQQAFTSLINKVSGKGTWESNPYVWVYEFELLK